MRKLSILLLVTFAITDCKNLNKETIARSANEKLIEKYFEHFNNHEWTELANMYIETSLFKDPSLESGIVKQTRKQIIEKYSKLNQAFPDLQDKVVQAYPSGDKHIIVEFVSSGTAPDNSRFELPICVIFTIEDGLITKDYSYFDNFDEQKGPEKTTQRRIQ
ncbi:nuclear transport factor 2 family protein [Chryseobacterium indoltheticum]|uniref:nuclear transport factor 2 family protein n=1 Tax=Chryseobacterium indoltheticum TaxID=254 RepID=UPI0019139DC8|nr:nuclear transport factor 2 family protein [Chryseobacterium indoltheticum]QQQ29083.1 nuclear transport factor 2 family protein [Chryseobacterium indoltheticum]